MSFSAFSARYALALSSLAFLFFAPLPARATAIGLVGDLAPNTNGGTFSLVGGPDISGTGDVSFYGAVAGGTAFLGVFVGNRGTTSAVALDGMTAPGTAGPGISPVAPPGLSCQNA
jgi:hypothetical protein